MKIPYLLIIITAALSGCAPKQPSGGFPAASARSVSITFEDIDLPFDIALVKSVQCAQSVDSLAYFLNTASGQLLVYNLPQRKFLYNITLADSVMYRDSLGEVSSFYVHTPDSIYVLQEFAVSLVNRKGGLVYRLAINTDTASAHYYYKLSANFPIVYEPAKNRIYVQQISTVMGGDARQKYGCGVEAVVAVETGRADTVALHYPPMYLQNYYGFADEVARAANNGLHIYSFMVDPALYVVDVKTNAVVVKNGRSRYHKQNARPLPLNTVDSSQLKMEMMQAYPVYANLLYDSYRKLYYRIFYADQTMQNADGTYNVWADKEMVLMVFDENFALIDEKVLPKNTYGTLCFVSPEGLVISRMHYKNEARNQKEIIPLTIINCHEK